MSATERVYNGQRVQRPLKVEYSGPLCSAVTSLKFNGIRAEVSRDCSRHYWIMEIRSSLI